MTTKDLYLNLIRKCLLNTIYEDESMDPWSGNKFSSSNRDQGSDWPSVAHSMIGNQRMLNIQKLVEIILQENIPGDFIETGIWRGGACIFMRALLKAYNVQDRIIWAADSFEGLPKPDPIYPADGKDKHHTFTELAVSLEQVKANFEKYDLLDEQVKFLKGWFKDTLHSAPIQKLALIRLDGDMYQSTIEGLTALYGKLSEGGFIIIDDYGAVTSCQRAVSDFRGSMSIEAPIHHIDKYGVYWRKIQ